MDERIKEIIFKDIYKVIYEIKKCHSKSRYEILTSDLDLLYQLCEELEITDYPLVENYSNKSIIDTYYKQNNKYFKRLTDDELYNISLTNNLELFDVIKYKNSEINTYENKVNFKDSLEYVIDFFKQYNPKLLMCLEKCQKDKKFIVASSDKEQIMGGVTYPSYDAYTSYVIINKRDLIDDSISIAHEFAHYYINEQNKNKPNKIRKNIELSYFGEVYSYYISLICSNYLKEKHICSESIHLVNYSIILELYFSLKDIPKIYNGKCQKISEIQQIIDYSYGILIAYHFYDLYLKDRELADYKIEKFLQDDGFLTPVEILEKNNLKEEIINSKILKKYI